jgi:hypothetical protein
MCHFRGIILLVHRQESAIVYQNITNPNTHGNPMESITQETQDILQMLSTHFQQIYPSLSIANSKLSVQFDSVQKTESYTVYIRYKSYQFESIIYVPFSWYHFACAQKRKTNRLHNAK